MNAIPHPITEEAALNLLASIPFSDLPSAARGLARLTRQFPDPVCATCLPHLLQSLDAAADPGRVLASFERFVENYPSKIDLTQLLSTQPRSVEVLALIFSGSQYLTDILLRRPEQIHLLLVQSRLTLQKTTEQFTREALAATSGASDRPGRLNALRRWQRGELLRIGAGDLVGQLDLPVLTRQLSYLAEGVVRAALVILTGSEALPGFAVISMGKLGGRELNYSSDIDLLFVSVTDDPVYSRLGQQLIAALAGITEEGFLYRVDMRLRPWGRTGALVPSLDAYLTYLSGPARLWEKQALLKARWIAGDAALGQEFLARASGPIYDLDPETIRKEVLEMKQRTETYLHQRGRDWGEVKLGEGSIRDVEFIVQYLQMAHGARQPELRTGRTLSALRRLHQYGLLPLDDRRTLLEGYLFLRTVEHHLQLMHYRQSQTLPADPAPQRDLARRLGFDGPNPAEAFLAHYQQHSSAIRDLYLKYIAGLPEKEPITEQPPEVRQHIERMDPTYEATFSAHDVRRHAALVGELDANHLAFVEANPLEDEAWRVTVIAFDYPGELALICGLMFSYGLDIMDGSVFTYEPLKPTDQDSRRKIVDVFTVRPTHTALPEDIWTRYASELESLLALVQQRDPQAARLELARRAAGSLGDIQAGLAPLYPIEIEIDNDLSERYTVLRINSTDTIGFLYELTNALALTGLYIARMEIETAGQQVADVIYVTDEQGQKITSPEKLRELRAAAVLIKHFTHLLPLSPDPQSALLPFWRAGRRAVRARRLAR